MTELITTTASSTVPSAATSMLQIRVEQPSNLSPDELARWSQWQAEQPALSSPYFRPEFMQAVSQVRTDVEIAVLERAGETVGFLPFQRGRLNIGKPVGGKLCDFHGCITEPGLIYDPAQIIRAARLATWDFEQVPASQAAFLPFEVQPPGQERERAPGLELRDGFAGWCETRREQGSQIVSKTMQKVRKLAREQGELTLELQSHSQEAFEQLLAWKSAQYQATGLTDVFAFPWTRALLEKLWAKDGAEFGGYMSVLRAGQRIVAVTYSLRSRHIQHAWFTAYDRELSAYSPGLIQFLKLAEAWPTVGISRFELGKGDERFKWNLATDSQAVIEGTVASKSLATWLRNSWRKTRSWVHESPLAATVKLPARLLKPLRQWLAYR
ncbi:GNAT family N-acetyltransferase [Anatilimnocola sp. NA78]|uniref:GNAT family N-acetyltransferase n=1 Tax=Anatilimnocola sp. NA78 TaxID=3415683 RepID=UPI003CE571D8